MTLFETNIAGFYITLSTDGVRKYEVSYGADIKRRMPREEAAAHLGQCIFHATELALNREFR